MAGGPAQILLKIANANVQTPNKLKTPTPLFLPINELKFLWNLAFNRKGGSTMPDRSRGANNYLLFAVRNCARTAASTSGTVMLRTQWLK